jgi:hypothetical protein
MDRESNNRWSVQIDIMGAGGGVQGELASGRMQRNTIAFSGS